jgi:hypothetical protein
MNTEIGKHKFLVGYDYGNGGLWGTILARSAEGITALYPELAVFEDAPSWMSREYFEKLSSQEPTMDVDLPPAGILDAVLAAREQRAKSK